MVHFHLTSDQEGRKGLVFIWEKEGDAGMKKQKEVRYSQSLEGITAADVQHGFNRMEQSLDSNPLESLISSSWTLAYSNHASHL